MPVVVVREGYGSCMAFRYRSADRAQQFLLPPAMIDWLPEEHLVWFVLDVVAAVDTSAFHARHPNDGAGRPAYDPEVMLALLVYAYCIGLRSSRRIETACSTDLAFLVICGGLHPDHRSIARFRARHEDAIKDVFCDVLALCSKAGLVSLGTIAIDGTKIAADAALDQNRSKTAISQEVDAILAAAATADAAAQPTIAGRLPDVLANKGSRRARLEAAMAQIEADQAAAAAETARRAQRLADDAAQGRKPKGPTPKDPDAAVARTEAALTAAEVKAAAAKTTLARLHTRSALEQAAAALDTAREAAAAAPAKPEPQANVTDPDSKIMKTAAGWLQGFNAQAAVDEHQIIVAASLTNNANDVEQLVPMMDAVASTINAAGIDGPAGIVLADAGYWSETNATTPGPDRLIATQKDWKQRRAARQMGTTTGPPPPEATPIDAMEHRLRTTQGAATYAKRSTTVEPVFGQMKENRGYRRFMRRGLTAANSEWSLICWTGNLIKLFVHADGQPLNTITAPAT